MFFNSTIKFPLIIVLFCILCIACEKETITIGDNDVPSVNYVPQIRIESYVNRTFIDLIGREPIDSELQQEVSRLKNAQLSEAARTTLIDKLQNNTDFIEGDTSYLRAYHQHLYNLAKIRCLEGVSDQQVIEFVVDSEEPELSLLISILESRQDMQDGLIFFNDLFGRLILNKVYDQINMNSSNFINATFDNLLWRYPSDAEFDAGFDMVEYNSSAILFGTSGQTKEDYVNILVNSIEMYEGIIIWCYQQLLSRPPTTEETVELLEDFYVNKKIQKIQRHIMITDEYANF